LTALLGEKGASGFLYTVRDNTGRVFWNSPTAQSKAVSEDEAGTEVLRQLCGMEGTTAVARFDCLHDSYFAAANMKDAAITRSNGYVWYDNRSWHWLEPEKELARQYVVNLAVECAQLGFDELLLEELCYPTRGNTYKIDYSKNTMEKKDALALLLTDLRTALEPYGTKISLLLTEEQLLEGSNADSGVDLAALLPLVDGVYAAVANPDDIRGIMETAVAGTEGAEAPVLVRMVTDPTGETSWCISVS